MMEWLLIPALVLCLMYLAIQSVLLYSLKFRSEPQVPAESLVTRDLPSIDILVAARNEARNIIRCLESLDALNYPKNKMTVWIGNDHSEDETGTLVEQWIQNKPHFHLVDIKHNLGKAKGKANVLAQLAHKATSSFLLITDADIQVHPNWAVQLVTASQPNRSIVSGITVVEGHSFLGRLQQTDWLYLMGLLQGFDNLGLHASAVGNNMLIRKEAYEETGGYEQLDFSVTEDFKLFKEVKKNGGQTRNVYSPHAVNRSEPVESVGLLLNQRKRWLTGALEMPVYWWLIFGIFGLYFPVWCVVLFWNPTYALLIETAKLLLQFLILMELKHTLRIRSFRYLPLSYELFTFVLHILNLIHFIIPVKVKWKGRSF